MSWLVAAIIAYLLFAIASVGDKYVLAGPPNPSKYTFSVGILGGLILILAPFVGFFLPGVYEIVLAFFIGLMYLFAIFSLYYGLEHYEVSRVVPAIGGLLPLFSFLLVYILSGGENVLKPINILALTILTVGSVLITYNRKKKIHLESLKVLIPASVFFALVFVSTRYLFDLVPFWTSLILIKVGAMIFALLMIAFPTVRKNVFAKKDAFDKKTGLIFLVSQVFGAGGYVMQNFSIALAPLAFVPVVNSLAGAQYVFLFIFSLFLFRILKEKNTKEDIIQKIVAIVLIISGLAIIAI